MSHFYDIMYRNWLYQVDPSYEYAASSGRFWWLLGPTSSFGPKQMSDMKSEYVREHMFSS